MILIPFVIKYFGAKLSVLHYGYYTFSNLICLVGIYCTTGTFLI